jgi:hypothetical protein
MEKKRSSGAMPPWYLTHIDRRRIIIVGAATGSDRLEKGVKYSWPKVEGVTGGAGEAWELRSCRRLHGPCCKGLMIPGQPLWRFVTLLEGDERSSG